MTTFSCMLHSTPLLFPLLAVKCWRMEAAGNSLAQSSSCKVGTFAAHNYVSGDIQCIRVYFRLFAALSNTSHVEWDVLGSNGMVVWPLLPAAWVVPVVSICNVLVSCSHVGSVDILVDIPVSTLDIYS